MNKNITTYETGAIRETVGKVDLVEGVSWLAMNRFATYMTGLQTKYGRGNWKKGIPIEDYERSLARHLTKYLAHKYDGVDLEPGWDHLSAIMFNVMGILHEEEKAKFNKKDE